MGLIASYQGSLSLGERILHVFKRDTSKGSVTQVSLQLMSKTVQLP